MTKNLMTKQETPRNMYKVATEEGCIENSNLHLLSW